MKNVPFLVVMGVSGCGKSTLAAALARELPGHFLEGDDYHTQENKEKMSQGIALTDEDRWPWFDHLTAAALDIVRTGQIPVLACSALKRSYREHLFRDFEETRLIYLSGDYETIRQRMDARQHEYMKSALLQSQFATLEEPGPEENALVLSIQLSPEDQWRASLEWLQEKSGEKEN